MGPRDSLNDLLIDYHADTAPEKVNLAVGVYRDDSGLPYTFPVVKAAERLLVDDESVSHDYLQLEGLKQFNALARSLLLGEDCQAVQENRVATFGTISGAGALRIGADLLKKVMTPNVPTVYLSKPSWPLYPFIFRSAGLPLSEYPYYTSPTAPIDFQAMLDALDSAKEGSVVLLQACCHNPTGMDLTREQWDRVAENMGENNLIPFFDCAYVGLASGDTATDAYPVREFARRGFQMLISQSFSKNFGLYGERTGCIHIVCSDSRTADILVNQLAMISLPSYISPPCHGPYIVHRVLTTPSLRQSWESELKSVASRLATIRTRLAEELAARGVDWNYLGRQVGMFSLTGMSEKQCAEMAREKHCYILKTGRAAMCGVNSSNVAYVASSIADILSRS